MIEMCKNVFAICIAFVFVLSSVFAAIEFHPVYTKIETMQGGYADIKFTVSNTGSSILDNIVIKMAGEIPGKVVPDTQVIYLGPRESKTVKFELYVGSEYPAGDYKVLGKIGYGNVSGYEEMIISVLPYSSLKGMLYLELSPADALKDDKNQTIGYLEVLKVYNPSDKVISNLKIQVDGAPADWIIRSLDQFTLKPGETKEIKLEIISSNFEEKVLNISVVKGTEKIVTKVLRVSGNQIGQITGFAILGGSWVVGLLLVVIFVLVLAYIRTKNNLLNEIDYLRTKNIFEKIIQDENVEGINEEEIQEIKEQIKKETKKLKEKENLSEKSDKLKSEKKLKKSEKETKEEVDGSEEEFKEDLEEESEDQ
ncbi:MAG: hypothetical protein QXK00_02765 [archaeon]